MVRAGSVQGWLGSQKRGSFTLQPTASRSKTIDVALFLLTISIGSPAYQPGAAGGEECRDLDLAEKGRAAIARGPSDWWGESAQTPSTDTTTVPRSCRSLPNWTSTLLTTEASPRPSGGVELSIAWTLTVG